MDSYTIKDAKLARLCDYSASEILTALLNEVYARGARAI